MLVIQAVFPLLGAFSPIIAQAMAQPQIAVSATPLPRLPGDQGELPLPVLGGEQPKPGLLPPNDTQTSTQTLARWASQTGGWLANPHRSDAVTMARGMVTGEASSELEQWLGRWGTSRVQLDIDQRFSLRRSQLDLLLPVQQSSDWLMFTQGGLHNADQRRQATLGLGIRRLAPDYLYGGNVFFDYDLSHEHARMGFGLEYWRNFLKLAANSYLRLSRWRAAPDVDDHLARPAQGWDVRAEGYLPAWPQLGATLRFEQYYGNDVALFDRERRQRDPYAFTAGINYTPFPLLTLSAEQRQGKAGAGETQLAMALNYRLGEPWRRQVDGASVVAQRRLAGSRYDLVDRNHQIVLEYRKQQVVHLATARLVTGYGGEKRPLQVAFNGKYPLARIDWTASTLIARGGQVVDEGGNRYSVLLPNFSPQGDNTYLISAVAVDQQGNASRPAVTQATVTQAAISTPDSVLEPGRAVLPADGKSVQQLVLHVMDGHGLPVDIGEEEISVARHPLPRGKGSATVSSFRRQAAGQYVATVTAGMTPETFELAPSARGVAFAVARMTLTVDKESAAISSMIVKSDHAIADGKASNVVMLEVTDAAGNRVPAQQITLRAEKGEPLSATVETDNQGEALVPVTSLYAGEVTVTAAIADREPRQVSLHFIADQLTARIADGDLNITPETAVVGQAVKNVRAKVTDAQGNALPDVRVVFAVDGGAVLTEPSAVTDDAGLAVTHLTSTLAGQVQVTATVNGHDTRKTTLFRGNAATAQVAKVEPEPGPYIADGESAVGYRAQIIDAYGNPLPGIPVDWRSNRDTTQVKFSVEQSLSDDRGIAHTTITSSQAYDVAVTAATNANSHTALPVMFVGGRVSAAQSSLRMVPATIRAEAEQSRVTIVVRDARNNLLSGLADRITLQAEPDLQLTMPTFSEISAGVYLGQVSGKKAGQTTLQAQVDGITLSSRAALKLIPDSEFIQVSGPISVSSTTATVGASVTYRATLTDKNGNVLGSGFPLTWSTNEGSVLSNPMSMTDDNGQVQVDLRRNMAGIARIKAMLPTGDVDGPDVLFSADSADEARSELMLTPPVIIAGKDTALLSLVLRDKQGNPLPGQSVQGVSDGRVTIAPAKEVDMGRYTMEVTATQAGQAALSVSVNGILFSQSRQLTVTADNSSGAIKSVGVDNTHIIAGDAQGVTYRATLVDRYGNVLSGAVVSWQLDGKAESYERITRTNGEGVAQTTVKSRQAGILRMMASLDETVHQAATDVAVLPAAIDGEASTFSADKTLIGSDGKEKATLTVRLRDRYGNGITGKNVTLQGAASLVGFCLSPLKAMADGVYQATATSDAKGQVRLTANVEGNVIGSAVTLTVGASTPALRFDNAEQQVVYSKSFTRSQAVKNAPSGVPQLWSSSDPAVASVEPASGRVTLGKAGRAMITVQTAGNAQYQPAMAQYTLVVAKASPGLQVDKSQITARWGDGKVSSMTFRFNNPDVSASQRPRFSSSHPHVVTVADDGTLQAVRPGTALIQVSLPETDQFLGETANVSYVLGKGRVQVTFSQAEISTTDQHPFTLQWPEALPKEADYAWSSSDANVVAITAQGAVSGSLHKGKTRLTLTVRENAFYQASVGAYDLLVYTKPNVVLGKVRLGNNGLVVESGNRWAPVYEGDTLAVSWNVISSTQYDRPRYVEVVLRDEQGTPLDSQRYNSPSGGNDTRFHPAANYFGKRIHVDIVAYGYDRLQHRVPSVTADVVVTDPLQIGVLDTRYTYRAVITSSGDYDDSCQASLIGRMHHALLQPKTTLTLSGGRRLIAPLIIQHRVINPTGDTRAVDYGSGTALYVSGSAGYEQRSSRFAVKEECWTNHYGGGTLNTHLSFAGKVADINQGFNWHG